MNLQHRPFPQLNSLFNWRSYRATHRLRCSLISDRFRFVSSDFCFSEEFAEVESYHLLQNYYPIVQSFNEEWKEKLSQADVDIFRQIEIKFTLDGPGLLDFVVCWRGEILALPGPEKICTTDSKVIIFVHLSWKVKSLLLLLSLYLLQFSNFSVVKSEGKKKIWASFHQRGCFLSG